MPEFIEVRCPNCRKRVADASGFEGDVAFFCKRCRTTWGTAPADGLPRLECRCRKLLAFGRITAGIVRVACPRDHVIVEFTQAGNVVAPQTRRRLAAARIEDRLAAFVDDRLEMLARRDAVQRAELAVGLRFQVFARDGFVCVYCGRSPHADGVRLEADHRVARSRGGPDTLDNLVNSVSRLQPREVGSNP